MNDLGIRFVWAALQVSLLGLLALWLSRRAERHGPEAAAKVLALTLVLTVPLTLLALAPLPAWWTWSLPSLPREPDTEDAPPPLTAPSIVTDEEPIAQAPVSAPSSAPGWSLDSLRRAWQDMTRAASPPGGKRWSWPGVVAAAALGAVGLGLLRLIVGLLAVRACWRRSHPVTDPALLDRLQALQEEMGCCRPVAVRELSDLTGPATVGWRRSLLLLPADWREWSVAEQQAALAHELAHVRRGDFLAGLLARACTALHFYHPLLHALSARLRLQQELAADALGARFSGGPGLYLRALARLALRQQGRLPAGPAPALFSHGTLMRRIVMLRAKERSPQRPPRPTRTLFLVVLTAAALAISALRGTAQNATGTDTGGPQPHQPPARADSPSSRRTAAVPAPFDLSCLPAETKGVVAFRPASLFALPGMKEYAASLNRGIATFLKQKTRASLRLPVEEIEQIICPMQITYNPRAKEGARHSLVLQPMLIRATHDFDWKKQLREFSPTLAAIHHAGVDYYPCSIPFLGPKMYAHFPDARTVVFGVGTEAHLRQLLDRKKPRPSFPWMAEWKRVECDLAAVAMDLRWLRDEKDAGVDPETASLARNVDSLIGGMNGASPLLFHAWASCPSVSDARTISAQLKQQVARLRGEMKNPPDLTSFLVQALVEKTQVRRHQNAVEVRSAIEKSLADVVQLFLAQD